MKLELKTFNFVADPAVPEAYPVMPSLFIPVGRVVIWKDDGCYYEVVDHDTSAFPFHGVRSWPDGGKVVYRAQSDLTEVPPLLVLALAAQ